MYTIGEVRSSECPVSLITPQSRDLIQIYWRSKSLKEVGISSHATADLPIPLADAFVVISNEENRCANASHDYDEFDRRHAGN